MGLVHFGFGNFTAQFMPQNVARNIFAKQIKIYIDIKKLLQQITRHSPLANRQTAGEEANSQRESSQKLNKYKMQVQINKTKDANANDGQCGEQSAEQPRAEQRNADRRLARSCVWCGTFLGTVRAALPALLYSYFI